MSAHAYTEDHLVEQPAIGLFAELGWLVAGPPSDAGVAGEPANREVYRLLKEGIPVSVADPQRGANGLSGCGCG